MNLRRAFSLIAVLGIALPAVWVVLGMNAVDWDFDQAWRDLNMFLTSVFGRVVLTGYFTAGLSLTMFVIYEANARSDYYLLWTLPILLIFGIGAALPYYLYLRMPKQE